MCMSSLHVGSRTNHLNSAFMMQELLAVLQVTGFLISIFDKIRYKKGKTPQHNLTFIIQAQLTYYKHGIRFCELCLPETCWYSWLYL